MIDIYKGLARSLTVGETCEHCDHTISYRTSRCLFVLFDVIQTLRTTQDEQPLNRMSVFGKHTDASPLLFMQLDRSAAPASNHFRINHPAFPTSVLRPHRRCLSFTSRPPRQHQQPYLHHPLAVKAQINWRRTQVPPLHENPLHPP